MEKVATPVSLLRVPLPSIRILYRATPPSCGGPRPDSRVRLIHFMSTTWGTWGHPAHHRFLLPARTQALSPIQAAPRIAQRHSPAAILPVRQPPAPVTPGQATLPTIATTLCIALRVAPRKLLNASATACRTIPAK